MPSLCRCLGDPRVVPCFHCSFLLGMPSSPTPGNSSVTCAHGVTDDIGLRLFRTSSAFPSAPTIRFKWAPRFRGFSGSPLLRPVELLASLRIRPGLPSRRDVYIRAFDVSVILLVAGYDYSGTWAISTGGTFTRWNGS